MKNLEDIKMKNIKNLLLTGIGVAGLALAVGLNGHNNSDNKKILKIEKNNYVKFQHSNGKVYEDLGKDGILDFFYDKKNYPVMKAIEIVDAPDKAKNCTFKQILRNSDEAINLQIEFNKINEEYEKQEKKKYKKQTIKK